MSVAKQYLNKLQKSPAHENIHPNSWADYIELVCLASIDGEVSDMDIIDRLSGRVKDLKEDTIEELSEFEKLEEEPEESKEPSRRAEVSIKWEMKVKDYFKILNLRKSLYGEIYPFQVTENCIQIKVVLSEEHLLYIYLVLCSNLYLFDARTRNELANCFELISYNAFKMLLPSEAAIHLFGKNPLNRKDKFSAGTFWKKLNKLIKLLNEKRNPHLRKTDFSQQHTGDEGLDLVGWITTGDHLPGSLIYFAQCACTYNFVEKQHSSSYHAWSQRLIFKNPPSNSTFIPHCFRRSDGTWIKSDDIQSTFLVDRRRILKFYTDTEKYKFKSLPVYGIVNEIINTKESIF